MSEALILNFFGIQGSGKGTQIELLEKYLKDKSAIESKHIYPGGEFRKIIESGTELGETMKDSLTRGDLQPNFLSTTIVANILTATPSKGRHLIFDGYPRSISQSESFEEMRRFFGWASVKIIYIELSKEEAIKRNMLRGRHDDTREGLEKRIGWYFDEVVPAMNYFKEKEGYEIITINGDQTIEDVHKEIVNKLRI